jgi:hypothetical protein
MPYGDTELWTVVEDRSQPVEPAEGFLSYLSSTERLLITRLQERPTSSSGRTRSGIRRTAGLCALPWRFCC